MQNIVRVQNFTEMSCGHNVHALTNNVVTNMIDLEYTMWLLFQLSKETSDKNRFKHNERKL